MKCRACQEKPVIIVSGNRFCKRHFFHYFERRVLKTIRDYRLIKKAEKVGVACSGGKDSLDLLHILNSISQDGKFFTITAMGVDEGIGSYRKKTLQNLKAFCRREGIPLKLYTFKKEYGFSLPEIVKRSGEKPCSICGVLRRRILNTKARELGLDKVAIAHNMDDEIQSILMNQFRRNVRALARLGPAPGIVKSRKFVKRVKPLYFVREKETASYAFLKGFLGGHAECPNARGSFRITLRDFVNNVETKHPGSKQGIVNSFLEMLPSLQKAYKGGELGHCKKCGEVSTGSLCQACRILGKLKG